MTAGINDHGSTDLHPLMKYIELHDKQQNVTEVEIPVPYGKIAGKWFGPKNVKPILCLHGYFDSCGTFDRLVPLLPGDVSFLAVDLPGHGHSSRLPQGAAYYQMDTVIMLLHIMKEYNWDRIALLCHSMGSIVAFIFAALFPEKVEFLIGIDALKPHNADYLRKYGGIIFSKLVEADIRNLEPGEPPSYTYEEMVEKLHQGTSGSVTKETCPHILQRNIRPSKMHPGKYYFSNDSKSKLYIILGWSNEFSFELARRVQVPLLYIKATESPYPASHELFDEMVQILTENNPRFRLHRVKASHHVHLTEPELIAPAIGEFLEKYRMAGRVASKM